MRTELTLLREAMNNYGIDVYIVPTGDFHGSEYLHDYFKTRRYVTGFTGSAGTLIVTKDEARLWTDGRYFLQAGMELQDSGIDLMKDKEPGVPSIKEYLEELFSKAQGSVLGFDGRTLPFESGNEYRELVEKYDGRISCEYDLVGEIWKDRPQLKGAPIWQLPLSSAGLPYETKIAQVRELMEMAGADYHLITTLDDNAWLYNLRGSDVEKTPVFFSYTLITPEDVFLYVFDDAYSEDMIPAGVTVKSYFESMDLLSVCLDVEKIPAGSNLLIDGKTVPFALTNIIPESVNVILTDVIPSSRLKAVKNEVEIESTKEAHINDGIAMVNFIHWLKSNIGKIPMSEISISDYLEKERSVLPKFLSLSFETIAGYMDHGAIVHYSATPESDAQLRPEGFLLVDSGGQYENGTTDITRTIAIGPLTDKMKECYTTILKGHTQLAMTKFPDGTNGIELDKITKAPLDAYGISYNHGTGHGVGHVLCVHEGPQRINTICEEVFIPGMITSNEPGYYLEGEFGIRIENEILCVPCEDGENDYCFRDLTCCPYEREAIIPEMLTKEEREHIDSYHAWVYESLKDKVKPEAASWLEETCKPL